jgi:hypothetical protein
VVDGDTQRVAAVGGDDLTEAQVSGLGGARPDFPALEVGVALVGVELDAAPRGVRPKEHGPGGAELGEADVGAQEEEARSLGPRPQRRVMIGGGEMQAAAGLAVAAEAFPQSFREAVVLADPFQPNGIGFRD